MLAPNRDFARPVIGVVGDATKEIVDASGGTVVGGDQVGPVGAAEAVRHPAARDPGRPGPARPDQELRRLRARARARVRRRARAPRREPVTVFEVKPVAGKPLTTTLQVTLQKLAEKTLGQDQAGRGAGRDPPVDRRGSGRGEQLGDQGPVARDRRAESAGIDVQGGHLAGAAAGRPHPGLEGHVPAYDRRQRQGVPELQRLPEQSPRDRSTCGPRSPSPATPRSSDSAGSSRAPRWRMPRARSASASTTTSASRRSSVRCRTTPAPPAERRR